MRRAVLGAVALVMVGGFVALLVVASGLVPVKASAGHWGITRAFLTFAMRRSVETHSIGTRVPELDDPALVLRGAGHYDRACQACHGAPDDPASVVLQQLTPEPPYLPDVVAQWEPAELFEIVRHGIKMTGMPAWPALEREDEVWAMVAFLQRLPGMDAAEYRRLARGESAEPADRAQTARVPMAPLGGPDADVLATCARCHGRDGLGRGAGAFPRIAGQREAYLAATLRAYARGDRHSGIMESMVGGLEEEVLLRLARHYARATTAAADTVPGAPPPPAASPADRAILVRGERIAREGVPERMIPSCVDCHGPRDGSRNPYYPALSGQYANYLELQLRLFRERKRGGSAYVHIMREVVHSLEPDGAAAVAAWYASLPWSDE